MEVRLAKIRGPMEINSLPRPTATISNTAVLMLVCVLPMKNSDSCYIDYLYMQYLTILSLTKDRRHSSKSMPLYHEKTLLSIILKTLIFI